MFLCKMIGNLYFELNSQVHLDLGHRIHKLYLITACGVRLDSQMKLAKTPFQVDLNCISRSEPALKPAGPTNTRCFTCSGYYTNEERENEKTAHRYHSLIN